MPKTYRIAVILEFESSESIFEIGRFNAANRSAAETEAMRGAVMRALPGGVKRVVAITSPEMMKALLNTHELAAEMAGVGKLFSRPPEDYEPPDGR